MHVIMVGGLGKLLGQREQELFLPFEVGIDY
jgi:hypothetical protein